MLTKPIYFNVYKNESDNPNAPTFKASNVEIKETIIIPAGTYDLTFWGNSFCVNPFGKEIYSDSVDEVSTCLEIDLNDIEEARKIWPFFRDRRTDSYRALEESWL